MVLKSDPNTVDGLPPVDEKIEIDSSGKLDPTNEEAQRALAIMNGHLNEDGSPIIKEEPKTATAPAQFVDEGRDAIAKNFRASNRGKQEGDDEPLDVAGAEDGPNSDAMKYGTTIANANKKPAEAAAPAATAETQAEKPKVKVKVDGVEMDVTHDELVANYQIGAVARARLQQATELLNSAKTVVTPPIKADGGEARTEAEPSTAEPARSSTPKGAKIDQAKVAKAFDAIQMGTAEEGTKALTELLESVVPQQNSSDIKGAIRQVLASDKVQTSSEEATKKFVEKYPAMASDEIVQEVAGQLVVQSMVDDFVKAAGLTADQIRTAFPTKKALYEAHTAARTNNPEFGHDLNVHYENAAKDPRFMKLVGSEVPAPKVDMTGRTERKLVVQQQPSHRTPAPIATAQTVPLTREQRMSEAARKMAISRGQNVAA